MNKEAKIGLTVILVLIAVFVAVLGGRLYRSYTAGKSVVAEEKEGNKSMESAGKKKEIAGNSVKTKAVLPPVGQPTVVAASSATSKPPQSASGNDDSWSAASDSDIGTASRGAELEPKQAPSYMPVAPKPYSDDRYDRYKNTDGQSHSQSRRQDDDAGLSGTIDRKSAKDRYAMNNSREEDSRYSHSSRGFGRDHTATTAKAGRTYTVAEGESLFDIARAELGKASRWAEIYDLNVDVLDKDLDSLTPGTKIVLPGK
jgi:nucleoid-associated protein YgaU